MRPVLWEGGDTYRGQGAPWLEAAVSEGMSFRRAKEREIAAAGMTADEERYRKSYDPKQYVLPPGPPWDPHNEMSNLHPAHPRYQEIQQETRRYLQQQGKQAAEKTAKQEPEQKAERFDEECKVRREVEHERRKETAKKTTQDTQRDKERHEKKIEEIRSSTSRLKLLNIALWSTSFVLFGVLVGRLCK